MVPTQWIDGPAMLCKPVPKRRARVGSQGVRADSHHAIGISRDTPVLAWLKKEIYPTLRPQHLSVAVPQAALPSNFQFEIFKQ
jgi:hypothetical protein